MRVRSKRYKKEAQEVVEASREPSRFKGFGVSDLQYTTSSFDCKGCSNLCEIVQIKVGGEVAARWGGRCNRWDM